MERSVCNRNCWISGAIAGVVVLLFSSGIGSLGWGAGVFLGLLTFALFGALLVWLVCHDRPQLADVAQGMTVSDWEREVATEQPQVLLASAPLAQMPIVAGSMPGAALAAGREDDLKRIKGVGPKLADWLVANGVTRFDQIAAWDDAAVADFAQRMGRMGGRIALDDWVGQARVLAAGGATDHSRRVDHGAAE